MKAIPTPGQVPAAPLPLLGERRGGRRRSTHVRAAGTGSVPVADQSSKVHLLKQLRI
ncbi:MAG TPA: hypothetical protein VFM62_04030 [Arthrobacter sp.]|nr:hypothetical protein [Arthrobacter sp.]